MKPRLAFVDHSFHKKTLSANFFREVLGKNFLITDFWDSSWDGGKGFSVADINSGNFEYVVFFQVLPPIKILREIRSKILWVPMHDSVFWFGRSFWLELSTLPIKILSFSETVTGYAESCGLDVCSVRYFPEPGDSIERSLSGKRVFFWQRTDFSFREVKLLIGNQSIESVILKIDPDPGYKAVYPSKEDMERYHIRIIGGNLPKDEYMSHLNSSNVFIAPRKSEGIGMSFLEAMSRGMAVVAFDAPTMNEYIRHGETGYLFRHLNEINLDECVGIGKSAREECAQGYVLWKSSERKILEFLGSPFRKAKPLSSGRYLLVKSLRLIYAVAKKFGIQTEVF